MPERRKAYDIFGSGGGKREADRLRVPLLGEIPIEIGIRESGDLGRPITATETGRPGSPGVLEGRGGAPETLEVGKN